MSAEIDDVVARALEREQRYWDLIRNVPAVIWTASSTGETSFVSGATELLSGYSLEEATGETGRQLWFQSVHPEDIMRVAAAFEALFRDGTPYNCDYRFRHKDGRWRWFADRTSSVYVRNGERMVDGITYEVTDRMSAELQQTALAGFSRRALVDRGLQELTEDTVGTATEMLDVSCGDVFLYDPAGDVFAGTCSGWRMPNTPDQFVARAFASETPILVDLQNEIRSGIATPIRSAVSYGVLFVYADRVRHFNDREIAFVKSMANVLANAMERDRTQRELEEAERRLRRREAQLLDAQALAHCGSFELDLETGRAEWSDEMYRLAGFEPQSRPIDRELMEALFEWVPQNSIEALEAGEILDFESPLRRPDGTVRVVHARARMLSEEERWKLVGTVQDVTDSRHAELALRSSETRLRMIVSRLPIILWSTDLNLRLTSLTGAGFESLSAQQLAYFEIAVHDLIQGAGDGQIDHEHALEGRITVDSSVDSRELRIHSEPLRDESGAVIGTVGIAFDITAEKRGERANRELLEKLHVVAAEWRDTFDSIETPIVIADAAGRLHRMNEAALRLSRFTTFVEALGTPVASSTTAGAGTSSPAVRPRLAIPSSSPRRSPSSRACTTG